MSARVLLGDVAVGDELPELSVEVTPTTVVLGALASRDWRPMHHDFKFATERNGVRDIFLNTPNQAAWIERYVTDWTGPSGRLGQMTFRMRDSVFPGDTMTFSGTVTSTGTDDTGCGWVGLEITLTAGTATTGGETGPGEPRVATTCTARVAVPTDEADNPWARRGDDWKPANEQRTH
ncbi:MAG: MaoC/PaaZ C-terminal domain-containing protein [Microthrixaceae bacterium]